MKIVLLERVEHLGAIGDVVTVKDGYARNFLLPQKKALRATEANMKRFEQQRADIEARNADTRAKAEAEGVKLDGQSFILIRQAGESGQLYGSVAARDIAEIAVAGGFTVGRNQVVLNAPIKNLGIHKVSVRLHPEVVVTVQVNIARSADEAERQAKGEDVVAAAAAADRELVAEQAAEQAAIAAAEAAA
jgi:large subunit ribosomal protein L9